MTYNANQTQCADIHLNVLFRDILYAVIFQHDGAASFARVTQWWQEIQHIYLSTVLHLLQ